MKQFRSPRPVALRRHRLLGLLLAVMLVQSVPSMAVGCAVMGAAVGAETGAALGAESQPRNAPHATAMHCHGTNEVPVTCEPCRHHVASVHCSCLQGVGAAVLPAASLDLQRSDSSSGVVPQPLPQPSTVDFVPPLRPPSR